MTDRTRRAEVTERETASALQAARAITDDAQRTEALAGLALHLPEAQKARVLAQALQTASAIGNERRRAEALVSLAAQLPVHLLGEALQAVRAIDDEWPLAVALGSLAPHLPESLLVVALDAAKAIKDDWHRAEVLAALAPHLPQPWLGEALQAAGAIEDRRSCAEALRNVAPHLADPLLAEAFQIVSAIEDEWRRALALGALAPYLPESLLTDALDAARAIEDDRCRAFALQQIEPHLPAQPGAPGEEAVATEIPLPDSTPAASPAGDDSGGLFDSDFEVATPSSPSFETAGPDGDGDQLFGTEFEVVAPSSLPAKRAPASDGDELFGADLPVEHRRPQLRDWRSPEPTQAEPADGRPHHHSPLDDCVSNPAPADAGAPSKPTETNPGMLVFNPAERMKVGRRERLEIRLSRDLAAAVTEGLRGRGAPRVEAIEIGERARVRLQGDDFAISALSSEDQLVRDVGFTQWDFDVIPLRSGRRMLRLVVTLRLKRENSQELCDLPALEREIVVRVAPVHAIAFFTRTHWKWFVASVAIPLVAWLATGADLTARTRPYLDHLLDLMFKP